MDKPELTNYPDKIDIGHKVGIIFNTNNKETMTNEVIVGNITASYGSEYHDNTENKVRHRGFVFIIKPDFNPAKQIIVRNEVEPTPPIISYFFIKMNQDVNRIETVNTKQEKMVYDENKVHQPTTLNELNELKKLKTGGNPRKSKKIPRKSKKSARKSKRRS